MLRLGTTATLWQLVIAKYCITVGYYKGRDLQTATIKWAKMIQRQTKYLNKNNSNIISRMGWDKGCQNPLFTFRILQCSGGCTSRRAKVQSGRCCDHEGKMYQSTVTVPNVNMSQRHSSLLVVLHVHKTNQWILILSHACMEKILIFFWPTCLNCVNALCESCYCPPVNSISQ